jgi:pimeloyl-ACP methyl ester carboxylesterase
MANRRNLLQGMGATSLAAATTATPTLGQTQRRQKTYVLVHGASHGGWCWRRVADPLRAAGHRVFTPTFTGMGDRTHLLTKDVGLETVIQDIAELITMEDLTDVVLVGHSFAGGPISAVADRMKDRIGQLVYLDCALLQSGQGMFDLLASNVSEERRKQAKESPTGLTFPAPPPSVFGVTDPADAAWLASHLRPQPIKTYEDRLVLENPLGNGLPKTYIACVKPTYPIQGPFHNWARQQRDWTYIELQSPHDAMVVEPAALTDILLKIG